MERRRARLHKLQTIYRRREPARTLPDWNLDALSQDEMLEFDDLLREPARYQARTGTTDTAECYTATLTAAQLERLGELWSKVIA